MEFGALGNDFAMQIRSYMYEPRQDSKQNASVRGIHFQLIVELQSEGLYILASQKPQHL
jgi:hypothetical protein